MAFGDSITAGVGLPDTRCGSGPPVLTMPMSPLQLSLERQRLTANLEARKGLSYPSLLGLLLKTRHPHQLIDVINEGNPGEEIAGAGARFSSALQSANHPHAVLLLEGINDINQHGSSMVDTIAAAYQTMIRQSRAAGAAVIVSTILPERRGACRAYDWLDGVNDVAIVNARIRSMALEEGANVIDLYSVFEPQLDTLLGVDGLHPTDAGYQVMAQGFFAVIEKLFTDD